MKRLSLIDSIKNWNRKLRWNRQYKNGKWNYLFNQDENPRYAKIIELITHYTDHPKLLDLGAGEGVLRYKLNEKSVKLQHYCGIDFSEVSIQKAKAFQFENSDFFVEDLHYYEANQVYDVIVLNEAFYYINQKLKNEVLDRIISAIAKDGLLIVSMFKEGGGCWTFFNHPFLKEVEFTTIESSKAERYWKVGAYKKTSE